MRNFFSKIDKNSKLYHVLFYLRDVYRKYNFISLTSFDIYYIKPRRDFRDHKFADLAISDNVIFISCRDNYDMLFDILIPGCVANFPASSIIIVDDASIGIDFDLIEKKLKNFNILFTRNKGKGLQWGLRTVLDYLNETSSRARSVLHLTHDNYPVTADAEKRVTKLTDHMVQTETAIVGFNHLDYRMTRKQTKSLKRGHRVFGMFGRSVISGFSKSGWYDTTEALKYGWTYSDRVVHVEAVSDMSFLLNRRIVSDNFTPRDWYRLHIWADDVCMQMLSKNYEVVADLGFYFFNCQEIKRGYGITTDSVKGAVDKTLHFSGYGPHLEGWRSYWGWDRITKEGYNDVASRYENTLIASRHKLAGKHIEDAHWDNGEKENK